METNNLSEAAAAMGKKGGRAKADKLSRDPKAKAREKKRLQKIGKLGGRPKGKPRKIKKEE